MKVIIDSRLVFDFLEVLFTIRQQVFLWLLYCILEVVHEPDYCFPIRPVNVVCWRRAICLEFMEKVGLMCIAGLFSMCRK